MRVPMGMRLSSLASTLPWIGWVGSSQGIWMEAFLKEEAAVVNIPVKMVAAIVPLKNPEQTARARAQMPRRHFLVTLLR